MSEIKNPWGGCACHGETFCPDQVFIGYDEDDVPIFVSRADAEVLRNANKVRSERKANDVNDVDRAE